MATKVGDAFVDLSVQDHRFNAKMGAAKASVQGFGTSVKSVVAGLGGLFLARGLWRQFKTGVSEVARAEMELTKLDAVLASTGYKAGFTAAEIGELADKLERTAGISTEDTLAAASALATFVEIGSTEFKALIPVIQDMSKVMSTDMKGAALQLGKAFQEPTRAMSALRRSGVSFTEQQVDMIKKLEASGRLVDAQRIMLRLLKEQGFDQVADAIGGSFQGQLDRAALGFGHLREQATGFLLALTNLDSIGGFADMMFRWGDAIENTIIGVKVWKRTLEGEWAELIQGAKFMWESLKTVFAVGWDNIKGIFGKDEGLDLFPELKALGEESAQIIQGIREQTQASIAALYAPPQRPTPRPIPPPELPGAGGGDKVQTFSRFADIIKAAQSAANQKEQLVQLKEMNGVLKQIEAKTQPQLPAFAGA